MEDKRSGEQERGSNDDDAAVRIFSLETVGEKAAGQDADQEREKRDDSNRERGFAKTEFLVVDGKVSAPREQRDAGECNARSGDNHCEISRNGKQANDWDNFRARPAGRLGQSKDEESRYHANEAYQDEGVFPAVDFAHDAAKSLTSSTAEEHTGSENGLSHGAALIRERIGNHGLGGGCVSSFADADQSPRDEQEHERSGEAAGNSGQAPENNAGGYDLCAAPAVREKAARDAGDGENNEKTGLERTKLGVGHVHLLAEKREERDDDLAVGEVDKIDQSKCSKESNLIGS